MGRSKWLLLLLIPMLFGFDTRNPFRTRGPFKAYDFTIGTGATGGCTDGVDCYCDSAAVTGDAQLLSCEDYEDVDYYENTANDWAVGSGSPHNRGVDSQWFDNYGSNANMGFKSSDGAPRVGTACGLSTCSGLKEYCSEAQGDIVDGLGADCWGPNVNSGSCVDIQRSGDYNAELGTLTLTGGKGTAADVGSGNAHLAERWAPGNTCGITGTDTWTRSTEIGVTRAIAVASNFYTSGIAGGYLKFDEFSDSNYPYSEYSMLGNYAGRGDITHFPYRLFMFAGTVGGSEAANAADCAAAISGATTHVGGALSCNGGHMTYRADNAQYTQSVDFPAGTWACTQAHFSGMGTTNMMIKIWHNSELIFWADGINGTKLLNQAYDRREIDQYANFNADPPIGDPVGTTVSTYRYNDNTHIRAGAPVACSVIGF